MSDPSVKAETFRALHAPGRPLVLFNAWDAGSASAVTRAGASAIATGSWSVAAANGYEDGERVPLELALANLRRIVAATALPVTVDLERGYGDCAEAVARTIALAIEAGAVGCNLEDSVPPEGALRDVHAQRERIAAARSAADGPRRAFFVNARTDVFFQRPPEAHDGGMVHDALARAQAYADAGADGLFVPGLVDESLIAALVARSPLPVNVMVGAGTPALARLAAAGVARVSHGPGPYLAAMQALEAAARAAIG